MGFLNGLLKGLGFEGEKQTQPKVEKIDNSSYNSQGAEYDLTSMQNESKTYFPTNENEVQELVDKLKEGQDVVVDLSSITGNEYTRALDFMSGAIYCLNGKIKKVGDKTFLFCQKIN